jgi:hypothetical protein
MNLIKAGADNNDEEAGIMPRPSHILVSLLLPPTPHPPHPPLSSLSNSLPIMLLLRRCLCHACRAPDNGTGATGIGLGFSKSGPGPFTITALGGGELLVHVELEQVR